MTLLARSALKGVAWNWTGSAVLVVAQVASTAATARLVSPAEFGLYAAAQAVYGFAGFFCMRAVGQDLQRRVDLAPQTVGTAMSISLAASLLVAACIGLSAPLWADLWGVPDAAWAIRVFALALLLQSAATVPLALLRRDLRFGRAAALETGALVAGMTTGVLLAVELHSAVALAIGQVSGAAILLLTTSAVAGYDLRPSFHRGDGRALSAFASQVGSLGFLTYCTNLLPGLFVAREFGAAVLGLFSRARMMAELPTDYALASIYKVVYPLYGRVRDDPARTATLLRESLTLTTGFTWPAFAFLAGASPIFVSVVLGARWDDSAPYLTLFALGACALVPIGLLTNCAEALGWMRIIAARVVAFFAGVGVVIAIAAVFDLNVADLLLGIVVVQWLTYVATLRPFVRRGLLATGQVAADQGIHAAFALLTFGAGALCTTLADTAPLGVQILALCGGAAILCAAFLLIWPVYPAGRILARRLEQAMPRVGVAIRRLRLEAFLR